MITIIRKNIGVLLSLLFLTAFLLVDKVMFNYFDNGYWYIISSIERLIFGLVQAFVFVKFIKKEKIVNVLNFRNYKKGLAVSSGLFLMCIYFTIYLLIGVKSFADTSILIVISCLFFQQITTEFMEEFTFRVFLLEGYFSKKEPLRKDILKYALLSGLVFGIAHIIGCNDLSVALYRFFTVGIMGIWYAITYLYSRNIIIPMLMHFIYDVFANAANFVSEWNETKFFIIWDNYIYFITLAIMIVISLIFLIRDKLN